jgi:hypothetical protein
MQNLSTWELFLNEIKRNISPKRVDIESQLKFLIDDRLCSQDVYERIVQVREMASYEQAIIDFLHPPTEWKQANVKAEILHFGTITEALLEILLIKLYQQGQITLTDIQRQASNFDMATIAEKPLTFNQLVSIMKSYLDSIANSIRTDDPDRSKSLKDLSFTIINLKDERNKIHLSSIKPTNRWEITHEDYRLLNIRRKFDYLIQEIKELIK